MRIGFDARTTTGETGVAQYGKNLIAAARLIDKDDEFVVFEEQESPKPFLTAHIGFRRVIKKAKLDLLHVLGGAPPLALRQPYILTVHDLAIYLHPEWFPDGQWFSTRIAYPSAVRFAKRIIVPSTATKNDLMRIFKTNGEKIVVIPHGVKALSNFVSSRGVGETVDEAILRSPRPQKLARKDEKYILFLGTIEPRKNVSVLVRAFRRLIDSEPELREIKLLIAGGLGWKTDETIDEIRKTQCEGYKIDLLGRVTEEEKWRLLYGAACLAYPSFYEGFGLPVLEAMAAGTPVACSDASSLPETASGAALLADPADADAWVANLAEILKNKNTAADLRERGSARAKSLSWEKTAAATIEVYREVSAGR